MVGGVGGVELAVVVLLRFLNDRERDLVDVFASSRALIFAKCDTCSARRGSVSIDDDGCFTEEGPFARGLATPRFLPSSALW